MVEEEDDSERGDRGGAGCWSWRDLRRFEREREEERFFFFFWFESSSSPPDGVGSTARKGARLSTDKRRLRTCSPDKGQCPRVDPVKGGNETEAHCSAKWRIRRS